MGMVFGNDYCSVVLRGTLQVPDDLTSEIKLWYPLNISFNYIITLFIIIIYNNE